MADSVIAPFSMHGARDAMASGLTHIEEQVEGYCQIELVTDRMVQ